jgi:hypothetical protein
MADLLLAMRWIATVGRVDGHHRVEEESEVDALCLDSEQKASPSSSNDHGRSRVAGAMFSSSSRTGDR